MNHVEEGDGCPYCDGVITLHPVEGCTCFQSAPCSACFSNEPYCSGCGWRESDDDKLRSIVEDAEQAWEAMSQKQRDSAMKAAEDISG